MILKKNKKKRQRGGSGKGKLGAESAGAAKGANPQWDPPKTSGYYVVNKEDIFMYTSLDFPNLETRTGGTRAMNFMMGERGDKWQRHKLTHEDNPLEFLKKKYAVLFGGEQLEFHRIGSRFVCCTDESFGLLHVLIVVGTDFRDDESGLPIADRPVADLYFPGQFKIPPAKISLGTLPMILSSPLPSKIAFPFSDIDFLSG